MNVFKKRISPFIILSLVLCFACSNSRENEQDRKKEQDRLMAEHIEKRRSDFINNAQKKCEREFFQKAGEIVDSILLIDAKSRLDTIPKPVKVTKPEKPQIKAFNDSSRLEPLFDSLIIEDFLFKIQTNLLDSLLRSFLNKTLLKIV